MREDVFKLPPDKVQMLENALKRIIESGEFYKLAAFHKGATVATTLVRNNFFLFQIFVSVVVVFSICPPIL